MPRFRAVLFDFDGTLADSYAAITASVNYVLEHHGRPTLTEAKVRALVGHGLQQLMDTILQVIQVVDLDHPIKDGAFEITTLTPTAAKLPAKPTGAAK